MNNIKRIGAPFLVVVAVLIAVVQIFLVPSSQLDNIAEIAYGGGDLALVASYQGKNIAINLVDGKGIIKKSVTLAGKKDGRIVSIADMQYDYEGNLYILKDLKNPLTGVLEAQQLDYYDFNKLMFKKNQSHNLELESGKYRWISLGSSISLLGTDDGETEIVRASFDQSTIAAKTILAPKSTRTYAINSEEGIFDAVTVGSEVAYISSSGKLYVTQGNGTGVREVYPARDLDRVIYPLFVSPLTSETVYIGEQESGALITLDLQSGKTTLIKSGGEPFAGGSSYAPQHLLRVSMADQQNFVGVVKNTASDSFDLLISNESQVSVVSKLKLSILGMISKLLLGTAIWLVILGVVGQVVLLFINAISRGRTILVKLALTCIPMIAVTMIVFGCFAYYTYAQSILQSFNKQVIDEGNMLTALFGVDSFDEIEYPYDYTSEAYSYLSNQMDTRSIYTRTAYYERGGLYTGVDKDKPCFYPFDINTNSNASNLFRKAAFSGVAQTGVIRDENGERLVCITPIGGMSGATVYLLETGILKENMNAYTRKYLINYVLVATLFVAAIGGILMLLFRKILSPIERIKVGLEEFSGGNRDVRLENTSNDEFSDIIRVFNKMSSDIDAQLYDLRQISATYFRFIPERIFRLLGKENLGELELGSGDEREYSILTASLKLNIDRLTTSEVENLTNKFFHIVNTICDEQDAVLIPDSVNLRKLKIICPLGGDSAVTIALGALSRVDSLNAQLSLQNRVEVMFVVHHSKVYYGICGDEERLVPTIICGDADYIADNEELFRQFSTRLIVTESAFNKIDGSKGFNRYIGVPDGMDERKFGLYDFYDSSTPEEIRLIHETKSTFDKAMDLYRQKRYYDAKNLFAVVLRENQYDNVSRYYIFSCEQHL